MRGRILHNNVHVESSQHIVVGVAGDGIDSVIQHFHSAATVIVVVIVGQSSRGRVRVGAHAIRLRRVVTTIETLLLVVLVLVLVVVWTRRRVVIAIVNVVWLGSVRRSRSSLCNIEAAAE